MAATESAADTNKVRDKPKDIKYDSVVVDIDFHPHKDVIAAGLIEGEIIVHSYSLTEDCHELLNLGHHKKACRALKFSPSGDWLGSVSKDKSLRVVDMEQGAVKYTIKKAHECALYSFLPVNEHIVATGDEDGQTKVWDLRLSKTVMELKENEDFISDMVIDAESRVLVTSSGDGTVTAFDIRKHKMKVQSELFDSELLSLATVKRGRKVVCGSGEGVLNIFNWGEWGNISDRYPGHPMSVDCMVAINEDIICTGSMDGVIRAVNILPNCVMGEVGEHDEFPVENLAISRCKKVVASCSHDQLVKFWNVEKLPDEKVSATKKAKVGAAKKKLGTSGPSEDFFADLAAETSNQDKGQDDDSDDDDDDDDSDEDSDDDSAAEGEINGGEEGMDDQDIDSDDDDDDDDEGDDDDDSDDDDDDDEEDGAKVQNEADANKADSNGKT